MSVATSPPAGGATPAATQTTPGPSEACPLCGAPLHADQEWCLHCGAAARTRLAPSPSWKGLTAALAVVVALSLGVLAAALVSLAGGGSSPSATTTTVTTVSTAAAFTNTSAATTASAPTPTTSSAPGAATKPTTTAATGAAATGSATATTSTNGSTAIRHRIRNFKELLRRLDSGHEPQVAQAR